MNRRTFLYWLSAGLTLSQAVPAQGIDVDALLGQQHPRVAVKPIVRLLYMARGYGTLYPCPS